MDISIIVGGCDKYQKLWKNFSICFHRHWKVDMDVIFFSETLKVPGFKTINGGPGSTWAECLLASLNSASTKYIFILLDDYFLNASFTTEEFKEYEKDMNAYSMQKLQISPSNHYTYEDTGPKTYRKLLKTSDSVMALQPAIWDREWMISITDEKWGPWEFEWKGNLERKKEEHNTYTDISKKKRFFNAARKGHLPGIGWEVFRKSACLEMIDWD